MSKTKTFVFISILAVLLGVALATLCVASQSAEASTIYNYEEFYKRYYTDLGINDNLLLNSDFSKNSGGLVNYVDNQRFYFLDNWMFMSTRSLLNIRYLGFNDGIGFSFNGSESQYSHFVQFYSFPDGIYTLSVCYDDTVYTLTGSVSSSNTTWTFNMNTSFGRISITQTGVNIYVGSTAIGNTYNLKWVKLEEGSTATAYVPNSEELYRDFMECNNPNFVDFFSTTGSSATVDGDNYVHDYTLSDYLTNNGINSTLLSHNSCLTFSIPEVWTSTTAGGNREFTCFWDAATQSYTDADNSFYFYLDEPCVTVSSKVSDLQLWKPKYIYIYDFGDVYNDGFNNGLTVGELYSQYEIIDKVDLSTVLTSSDFHDSVLSSGSVITSEDNPIGYSSIPWENSSTLNYINDNFSNLYLLLYDKNSSNFFLLTPSDDVIIDGVNYGNPKVFGYYVQNNISIYSIQVGSTYFSLSLDFFIDNLFLTSVLYLVELKDDDDYVLYDKIWNSGYDTGFNVPYEIVYNDWKDEFYDTTYDAGYDAGYNHAQYNEIVTWNDFIPSIIGAFASFFLILLDIDVFGSNLLTLIGSIGACFLVIIIIKKLSGK